MNQEFQNQQPQQQFQQPQQPVHQQSQQRPIHQQQPSQQPMQQQPQQFQQPQQQPIGQSQQPTQGTIGQQSAQGPSQQSTQGTSPQSAQGASGQPSPQMGGQQMSGQQMGSQQSQQRQQQQPAGQFEDHFTDDLRILLEDFGDVTHVAEWCAVQCMRGGPQLADCARVCEDIAELAELNEKLIARDSMFGPEVADLFVRVASEGLSEMRRHQQHHPHVMETIATIERTINSCQAVLQMGGQGQGQQMSRGQQMSPQQMGTGAGSQHQQLGGQQPIQQQGQQSTQGTGQQPTRGPGGQSY